MIDPTFADGGVLEIPLAAEDLVVAAGQLAWPYTTSDGGHLSYGYFRNNTLFKEENVMASAGAAQSLRMVRTNDSSSIVMAAFDADGGATRVLTHELDTLGTPTTKDQLRPLLTDDAGVKVVSTIEDVSRAHLGTNVAVTSKGLGGASDLYLASDFQNVPAHRVDGFASGASLLHFDPASGLGTPRIVVSWIQHVGTDRAWVAAFDFDREDLSSPFFWINVDISPKAAHDFVTDGIGDAGISSARLVRADDSTLLVGISGDSLFVVEPPTQSKKILTLPASDGTLTRVVANGTRIAAGGCVGDRPWVAYLELSTNGGLTYVPAFNGVGYAWFPETGHCVQGIGIDDTLGDIYVLVAPSGPSPHLQTRIVRFKTIP